MSKKTQAAPTQRKGYKGTLHVGQAFLTAAQLFSNNRGETEGNHATLKKIYKGAQPYLITSADCQRFGLRRNLEVYTTVNRWFDESQPQPLNQWRNDGTKYADDELFGLMSAQKGKNISSRSLVGNQYAIAVAPFLNEISHHFASRGATPSASPTADPTPFSADQQHTPFQGYWITTPQHLSNPLYFLYYLKITTDWGTIGGNTTRYPYEFNPIASITRLCAEPSTRLVAPFTINPEDLHQPHYHHNLSPSLLQDIHVENILPTELVIAGHTLCNSPEAQQLETQGATLVPGIRKTPLVIFQKFCQLCDINPEDLHDPHATPAGIELLQEFKDLSQ